MAVDACVELVEASVRKKPWNAVEKVAGGQLSRLGFYTPTPPHRILEAVRRELTDLALRTEAALGLVAVDGTTGPALDRAKAVLGHGRELGVFPRAVLDEMSGAGNPSSHAAPEPVRSAIAPWVDRHRRLERRLRWLLDPRLTADVIDSLSAEEDADQLWCHVRFCFRPEVRYAWGNAIKRISQVESAATFFHSTGKAEGMPVLRTEDTALFYAFLFNWGLDSYHGRKAIAGMNAIHGRYFIHNDGMKYVLLNAAFTILDGLDVIGHRPLAEKERLGYFHAQIQMGQAMNIQGLSHSWHEMFGWFCDLNRKSAKYAPTKRRAWQGIETAFDRDAAMPKVSSQFRKRLEVAAMDDTFRSALGFERPSRVELALCRSAMKAIARARAWLPHEPHIPSLQPNRSHPEGGHVESIGEKERSPRMPAVCPFSGRPVPNKGYPDNQRPLLDVTDAVTTELPTVTWSEVRKHDKEDDLWLVWGGHVYDLSAFAKNHPGTLQVLLNGVGQDMTLAFEKANHTDLTRVFALNFRVAKIEQVIAPGPRPSQVPDRPSPTMESALR